LLCRIRDERDELRRTLQQQKEQQGEAGGDSEGAAAMDAPSSDAASDGEDAAGTATGTDGVAEGSGVSAHSESPPVEPVSSMYDALISDEAILASDGAVLLVASAAAQSEDIVAATAAVRIGGECIQSRNEIFAQIGQHISPPVGTAKKRRKKRGRDSDDSLSGESKVGSADEQAKSKKKDRGTSPQAGDASVSTKALKKLFDKGEAEDGAMLQGDSTAPQQEETPLTIHAFLRQDRATAGAAPGGEADEEDIGEAVSVSAEAAAAKASAASTGGAATAGRKVKYGNTAQQSGVLQNHPPVAHK
jgi:hypothetical protein